MRLTEHTAYPLLRPSVTFEQVEQAAYSTVGAIALQGIWNADVRLARELEWSVTFTEAGWEGFRTPRWYSRGSARQSLSHSVQFVDFLCPFEQSALALGDANTLKTVCGSEHINLIASLLAMVIGNWQDRQRREEQRGVEFFSSAETLKPVALLSSSILVDSECSDAWLC